MNHKWVAIGLIAIFQIMILSALVPYHPHSPYDVIISINTLRASYGLPPYAVDDLLMAAAQGQADYLASIAPNVGNGHEGPGGTDADARALAAGYPYVEGLDINENWAAIPLDTSIETLIATSWSDEAHMHTMLHERGQHIGVGVAVSGNIAYIIVDVAAYWGDAGLTQQPVSSAYGSSSNGGLAVSNYVAPVVKAETQNDGSIVHIVQSGQSLWLLAHHYGLNVERLKELNQMGTTDVIYIGQEILIQSPMPATDTPEAQPAATSYSPTLTTKKIDATKVPTKMIGEAMNNNGDMNLLFLLFFSVFGIGLILVVIGMQQR